MPPLLPPRVRASQRRRNPVRASGPGATVGVHPTFPEPVRPTPPSGPASGLTPQPPAGPLDPNYTARVGIANQQLSDTLGGLDYREAAARQQYGFDDASNPFSIANALKRNFEIAQRSATNSYAARGQLYSGAGQRAQDLALRNNEQGVDQARRDYSNTLQNITEDRARAKTGNATSLANASSDATIAALLNRPTADQVPAPKSASERRVKRPRGRPYRNTRR